MDAAASNSTKTVNTFWLAKATKFTLRRIHPLPEELTKQYLIVSIEDGLDESDWDGFAYQTSTRATKSSWLVTTRS